MSAIVGEQGAEEVKRPGDETVTLEVHSAKHVVASPIEPFKPECGFVWQTAGMMGGPVREHKCISVNHISTAVPNEDVAQIFHVCHCGESMKVEKAE